MLSAILGGTESRNRLLDPNWPGWSNVSSQRSDSGLTVTKERALMLAPVWQAVTMISHDVAKMPMRIAQRKPGGWEPYISHPAYKLVRWKANQRPMSAFQFWKQITADMLIYNNAYAEIIRDGTRRPVALVPLCPQHMRTDIIHGRQAYLYEYQADQQSYDAADVLHFRGLMLSYEDGHAPEWLSAAREVIGLGLATQKFQARFYRNGAKTSGILQIPASMPKAARDKLEEGFTKAHTGEDSWFKTVVLREGATFTPISQTNKDAEMSVQVEQVTRAVANFFNLPPSRLGLSDSVSYNSEAESNKKYFNTTLGGIAVNLIDEVNNKLLSDEELYSDDIMVEIDESKVVRESDFTRAQTHEIRLRSGYMTVAEIRALEGLPPMPELDEPEPPPVAPPVMEDDDAEDDTEVDADDMEDDGEERAWPTRERDEWLAAKKREHSWAELELMLQDVAEERGWTVLTISGLRAAVARCSMLSAG